MSHNRITLELRNSKSSELGPEAAEQLFAALPHPKSSLFNLFTSKPATSFEVISHHQTITFQINTPEDQAHYLQSQLTAAYPELLIATPPDELTHLTPFTTANTAAGFLTLKNASYYPLKTHQDFSETDPLSTTLGILGKLPQDHSALIQILTTPEGDAWKRAGLKAIEPKINSDGTTTPNPQKSAIEQKLNQTSHSTVIKLAVTTPDKSTSQQLLKTLAGSFSGLSNAQGNSLKLKTPILGKTKLKNSLPERRFPSAIYDLRPTIYLSIEELATLYHLPSKDLKDLKNIAWGKTLLGEPPENLPYHHPEYQDHNESVNFFARAEYKNQQVTYGIKDKDRRRHIYVMGKTGTGKSTLLSNMIISDLKRGKGVAVIDPHGDLVETVLNYIPSNRINDVIYLNPADPEYSVKLNLLEATGEEHKELIASGIIAIFQKLYSYSWGPRLEHILRNTLLTLISVEDATLEDIVKILTNKKFRAQIIDKLDDDVLKTFWLDEFEQMNDRLRTDAVSPILNKVGQFVSSPLIRNVINSKKNSFSIQEAMDEGKILLCNLSQGKLGEDNSALLGAMLITKIQLTAMNRVYQAEEDRRDFFLYVDEFQNFATTSFIKILSEARKYRLSLTLANQYIDQVDENVRKAIFGNAGTIITFLVGAGDAAFLSREFGGNYTEEDLVSLGRYQIINKLSIDGMTSTPFPGSTLPLASSSNKNKPKVIKVSRERYAKKKK